jgi:redox-sensitive bicupin YhaK (pirin superfamily)
MITIFREKDRGTADYGWLQAKYAFSFSNYYHPEKINFGALRVLNDDIIQGGMGFGTHPHDNMEIISIPLKGSLKHKDSMSKVWIPLNTGEVQVMTAGTGIQHAEMNNSSHESVNLFQIWIIPNHQNVKPQYAQKVFDKEARKNKLQILVSSIEDKQKGSLTIHQDAKISRLDLSEKTTFKYSLKSAKHGVYLMVISGKISIDNNILNKRDAIGISEVIDFEISSNFNSELLFIEVPMSF